MKYQQTLNAIYARLDRLGDLPIFSATVNRIQQISSSEESDAMALAMAVMKDANLSAKLLRLANSCHYNRGYGQISAISRAVVLLGFSRIKSLSMTLKLIETFSEDNRGVDISDLLMRSFLTASMSRELAQKAGAKEIEDAYICGLLFGLGEIVVAYTVPELYGKMVKLRQRGDKRWDSLQLQALGGHFSDIGQDLAQSWGFPGSVVQAMDPLTAEGLTGDHRMNHQLAAASSQMLELVYGRERFSEVTFSELRSQLVKECGLDDERVDDSLHNAYKMVCDLATEYGLSTKQLVPPVTTSGDAELDEFAHRMAYYVHSREQANAQHVEPISEPVIIDSQPEIKAQLDYLQELNELIANGGGTHEVLAKVVEAVEQCTGCQRAMFCLILGGGKQLVPKLLEGESIPALEEYFTLARGKPDTELFFRVLEKGMTLLVTDTEEGDWAKRLPASYLKTVKPQGFILSPLVVGGKTIGLLYADRIKGHGLIDDEDFKTFNQFAMQAKLALSYAQQNGKR